MSFRSSLDGFRLSLRSDGATASVLRERPEPSLASSLAEGQGPDGWSTASLGPSADRGDPAPATAFLALRSSSAGARELHDVKAPSPRRSPLGRVRDLARRDALHSLFWRLRDARALSRGTLGSLAAEHQGAFGALYGVELRALEPADRQTPAGRELAAVRAFHALELDQDVVLTDLRKATLVAGVEVRRVGPEERFNGKEQHLPESFERHVSRFYAQAGYLSEPAQLARIPAHQGTDDSDPLWWADHGVGHMRNVSESVADTLMAALKTGLIPARTDPTRLDFLEQMGRAQGLMHDMWMKDLTLADRGSHAPRGAREALRRDAPTEEAQRALLDAGMGKDLTSLYGIAPGETPRVLREALSLIHAHSKSAVSFETLRDKAALRTELQRVILDKEDDEASGSAAARVGGYGGREAFLANSYDWLVHHPELGDDMLDLIRTVRVADAFRWRGADLHGSQEAFIGAIPHQGGVHALVRLMDPDDGRTYHVRYEHPNASGEANVSRTAIGPDGQLQLGVRTALEGTLGDSLAEDTAHVFVDVWKDFVSSFESGMRRPVEIEAPPGPEGVLFAEKVRAALRTVLAAKSAEVSGPEAPAAPRNQRHLQQLDALLAEGKVRIVPAASRSVETEQAAARATDLEQRRFRASRPYRPTEAQRTWVRRLVRDGGTATEKMDFQRPSGALDGAKLMTLRRGDVLMARDAHPGLVYIPLDDDAFAVGLARGYRPPPARAGVPLGGVSALGAAPRMTDVVARHDGAHVLALPAETYLREWAPHFYVLDEREDGAVLSPGSLLPRLRQDYGVASDREQG